MKDLLTGLKNFFLLLLIFLGGLTCKTDQDFLDPLVDIPIAFRIEMKEKLQPGPRPLELILSSLEVLECTNYTIDYELDQNKSSIRLALKDLILTGPCHPGYAAATNILDLGVLDPGNIDLSISLKDIIRNEGTLDVQPESYSLRLETKDGLMIIPGTLTRIPDNTIWGGVFPKADSLVQLAQSFYAELTQLAQPMHLSSGDYGYFTVNPNFSITITDPEEPGEGGISFVYRFTGNNEDLIDLVKNYRSLGGHGLTIMLFDAEGNTY